MNARYLLVLAAALLAATPRGPVAAAGEVLVLERPAALEPDIAFWRRVYTEVTTDAGLIHDDARLDVVYDVVAMPRDLSPSARRQRIAAAKSRYVEALERLARNPATPLTPDESKVRSLWPESDAKELRAAALRVRFQLGQADRFRAGLERSGAWIDYIRATLAREGLPVELAALPHVESSFNTYAYSKVGAAGMWQFMPGTGRRFLRIDNVIDERLDPYRATEAAAQFLAQNHAVLGSWPLAITAYNHGAAGLRRAREQLGTDDIVAVVRKYRSRTFGFASRNFYVAFLAALEVDTDPVRYFPGIRRAAVDSSREFIVPHYLSVQTLTPALDLEPALLRTLNPALLEAVWNGSRHVPRGYPLRLPAHLDFSAALDRIPVEERFAAQVPDTHHKVSRGDTLSSIASRYRVSMSRIAALNGLAPPYRIRAGQTLVLPDAASAPSSQVRMADAGSPPPEQELQAAAAAGPALASLVTPADPESAVAIDVGEVPEASVSAVAALESREPEAAVMQAPAAEIEPALQAFATPESEDDLGPGLVAGAASASTADPADYTVASDGSIRIEAAETLGHYAEWLDLRASQLRTLNGMKYGTVLQIGRRLQLDFSRVSMSEFEQRRIAHHRELQALYFSRHHIAGSEVHTVRSGESVWVLSQRRYDLPLWLLRQYNPDVDFAALRPGTRLVIPRVEQIAEEAAT